MSLFMIRIQFAIHEFHMFTYHLSQTWDKAHTEALKKTLKFYYKQCLCEVKPIINWNVTWYTFGNIAWDTKCEKKLTALFVGKLRLLLFTIESILTENHTFKDWVTEERIKKEGSQLLLNPETRWPQYNGSMRKDHFA